MDIDEGERQELIARWLRCRSDVAAAGSFDAAVGELIDEACRGVSAGRISAERCARSGETFGRGWRDGGLGLPALADELASVRRSVWDTVANRLRADKASIDALVDARTMIDMAFDVALRRALAAMETECRPSAPDPLPPESDAAAEARGRALQADFYAALDRAIADCVRTGAPAALVVMHVEVCSAGIDGANHGADAGDVLEIVRAHLRRHGDRPFALSDSDFAIVCSGTDATGARALLERFSSAATMFGLRARAGIEVTGGFAVAPSDGLTSLDLIRVALADREFSIPGAPSGSRA